MAPQKRETTSSSPRPASIGNIEGSLLPRLSNRYVVEDIPLDNLRLYKRRLRQHRSRQIISIAAGIRRFGFLVPILITADSEIIAGEARVAAAREAGLLSVPAIRITGLSDKEIKAFRIADNKLASLGDWAEPELKLELQELLDLDFEVEFTGFSTAEVDILLDTTSSSRGQIDPADQLIPMPASATARVGDTWLLDKHRLHCGDARDVEAYTAAMAGEKARLVCQDPPYNVLICGHAGGLGKVKHREFAMASGEMSDDQFTQFLETGFTAVTTCLIDGGLIYTCMDWRHLLELYTAQRRARLSLLNLCIWNKQTAGMGSFYRSKYEAVAICKFGKNPHINNVQLGATGRYRTNVWDYPGVAGFRKGRAEDLAAHPTCKPVALFADIIRDASHHGDVVLDPFCGSGTTILAAERTDRRARAIEIDPIYVDVAIRRWETLTHKRATLEATGQSFKEVAAARSCDEPQMEDVEAQSVVHVRRRTRAPGSALA